MSNKQPIVYIPGLILVIFILPIWLLFFFLIYDFSLPEQGIYTAPTLTLIVTKEAIAIIKGGANLLVILLPLPLLLLPAFPRLRRIKLIAVLVSSVIIIWSLYMGLTAAFHAMMAMGHWQQILKSAEGSFPVELETEIGRTGVWSERVTYTRKLKFKYPK